MGTGTQHRRRIGRTAALVAGALVLAACGDTADRDASTATDAVATEGTGGWVGGEPAWRSETGEAEAGDLAGTGGAVDDAAVMAAEAAPAGDGRDAVAPPQAAGLRAGSVDDNEDFAGFVEYLDRIASIGVALRDLDPRGRIVVTVTGSDGRPAHGVDVAVRVDGTEVGRVRTTADGTARVLPALHGAAGAASIEVAVGDVTATVAPGEDASLVLPQPGGAVAPIPLDVMFLLDTTGSMGDEIDQLKTTIDGVAARIAALEAAPDVRFGMTVYRDEGDSYVTATHDFTGDVDAFRAALADVVADGGGDYPEALDEGLAGALAAPGWRDPASTVQLVFLVADAPPQVGRQVPVAYPQSVLDAVGRGIKIFPVASSESDDQAEAVFRQLAQATGARFVFLSYGAAGAATGSSTDIDATDYEELSLDDLVVRLVAEELAALTGDPSQVPAPTPTSTTVPEGQ
jgi:hypothetical protein